MKLKASPFLSDLLLTTVTSLITVAGLGLMLRYLAIGLGPTEFGAFSIARRVSSSAAPVISLSLGIALPRYLALVAKDESEKRALLPSAATISLTTTAFAALLLFLFRTQITNLLFHKTAYESLLIATLVMLGGEVTSRLVYAYHRGLRQWLSANLYTIFLQAVIPVTLAMLFASRTDAATMVILFGATLGVTALPLIYLSTRDALASSPKAFRTASRRLLRYGLPRTPSGIAVDGLRSLGTVLAPYFGTLRDSADFAIGQSLLRASEGIFVGFGLVALPRLAHHVSRGREEFIAERITSLVAFVLQAGLFCVLHLLLWSDQIILLWLGPSYSSSIPIVRLVVISIVPYSGFVLLRSVIDAVEVKAVNTRNIYVGLVTATVLGLILANTSLQLLGLAIATTLGWFVVGTMSLIYLARRYEIQFSSLHLPQTIMSNAILLAIALAVHRYSETLGGPGVVMAEVVLSCSYLSYLWFRLKTPWLLEVRRHIKADNE